MIALKKILIFFIICSFVFSVFSIDTIKAESTVIAGDLNGDGIVDSKDVTMARRYLSGGANQNINIEALDVNADNSKNAKDVIAMRRYLTGGWNVELVLPSQIKEKYINEVLRLVNEERAKEGLNPYKYYYDGQIAADIRAEEIIKSFSHTRPDGRSAWTVFEDNNIDFWSFGENIAWGYSSPEEVVKAWMNSEGHRENILSNNFEYMIVGVKDNHWVQLFITL